MQKALRSPHTTLQEHWIRDFLRGSSHLPKFEVFESVGQVFANVHQVSDTLRLDLFASDG